MYKTPLLLTILSIISIFLLMSGCNPAPAPAVPSGTKSKTPQSSTPEVGNSSTQPTGYPVPQTTLPSFNNAYPGAGQVSTPLPAGTLPEAPKDAPQPDPGKGSISGVLFSIIYSQVIPGTGAYLTPGWGDQKQDPPVMIVGPRPQNGDIDFRTDSSGQFSVNNIPPGTYYLLVWAPLDWLFGQMGVKDETLLKINIVADQKLPLGVVYVPWS